MLIPGLFKKHVSGSQLSLFPHLITSSALGCYICTAPLFSCVYARLLTSVSKKVLLCRCNPLKMAMQS